MVDEDVLCSVDVLGGIGRILARNALAPALTLACDRLKDQDVALILDSERSLEASDERQVNATQLNSFEFHDRKGYLASAPSMLRRDRDQLALVSPQQSPPLFVHAIVVPPA
jgi:hypothetical protein